MPRKNNPPQYHILSSGIPLLHFQVKTTSVNYVAAGVSVGARNEELEEHGLSHFLEHLVFKGTTTRDVFSITRFLEDRGGDINAYTSKEETVYHAVSLKKDSRRVFEILADILFNPIFPEKEVAKERGVILEEIASYEDMPSELIFDDFDYRLFGNSGLGRPILGNRSSIKKISLAQIKKFHARHYVPQNIVLCSLSAFPLEKVVSWAERFFCFPLRGELPAHIPPPTYVPFYQKIQKKTHQAHCLFGNIGCSATDNHRYKQMLLLNILGGTQQNSLLNLELREKAGLVYQVESSATYYKDCGSFSVYCGTDKKNIDKVEELVRSVLDRFVDKGITKFLLQKAKQQFLAQMVISLENNENKVLSTIRSMSLGEPAENIENMTANIMPITMEELQSVASRLFYDRSTLIYY